MGTEGEAAQGQKSERPVREEASEAGLGGAHPFRASGLHSSAPGCNVRSNQFIH